MIDDCRVTIEKTQNGTAKALRALRGIAVMGDVAGFTSLGILPEPCGEKPPLLNGLQNTCLLNTKIPRDICGGVPCFLNRHMLYNGGGRDRSTARAALGEEFPTRTLSVCAAGS